MQLSLSENNSLLSYFQFYAAPWRMHLHHMPHTRFRDAAAADKAFCPVFEKTFFTFFQIPKKRDFLRFFELAFKKT